MMARLESKQITFAVSDDDFVSASADPSPDRFLNPKSPSYSYSKGSPRSGTGKLPKAIKKIKKTLQEEFEDSSFDWEEFSEFEDLFALRDHCSEEDLKTFYNEFEDPSEEEVPIPVLIEHLCDSFEAFKTHDKAQKKAGMVDRSRSVESRLLEFVIKESVKRRQHLAAMSAVSAAGDVTGSSVSAAAVVSEDRLYQPFDIGGLVTPSDPASLDSGSAASSADELGDCMVSDDIVEEIVAVFEEIDENHSGTVDSTEFSEAMDEFIDEEYGYLKEDYTMHVLFEYFCSLQKSVELDYVRFVRFICTRRMCPASVETGIDLITGVLSGIEKKALAWKQSQMVSRVRSTLKAKDDLRRGQLNFDQFFSALSDMTESSIDERSAQQMFNLTTANGETVKIDIFVERLGQDDSAAAAKRGSGKNNAGRHSRRHSSHSSQTEELSEFIKGSFAQVITIEDEFGEKSKPKDKKRRRKGSGGPSKSSGTDIQKTTPKMFGKKSTGATSLRGAWYSPIEDDAAGSDDPFGIFGGYGELIPKRDSFEQISEIFRDADENSDNKIDFEEFKYACEQVTPDLEESELKPVYYHCQQLLTDWELDVNDFLVHVKEEHITFPDCSPESLLSKYFLKIINEASAVDRFNQLLLDFVTPQDEIGDYVGPLSRDSSLKSPPILAAEQATILDSPLIAATSSSRSISGSATTEMLDSPKLQSPLMSSHYSSSSLGALDALASRPGSGSTPDVLSALAFISGGSSGDLVRAGSVSVTPVPSFAESRGSVGGSSNFSVTTRDIRSISRLSSLRLSAFPSVASTSPLLRRIHKPELREYIQSSLDILKNVTQEEFVDFVRSFKPETALGDAELSVDYAEWKLCVSRPTFKYRDLHEFDFLLYHLGLVIDRSLANKLSVTELSVLSEDVCDSPRASVTAADGPSAGARSGGDASQSQHAEDEPEERFGHVMMPSFMESQAMTAQLALYKQELFSTVETRQNSDAEYVSQGTMYDEEDTLRKRKHPDFIPKKFTLADLMGEFVDENDNVIKIRVDKDEEIGKSATSLGSPIPMSETLSAAPSETGDAITKSKSEDASSKGTARKSSTMRPPPISTSGLAASPRGSDALMPLSPASQARRRSLGQPLKQVFGGPSLRSGQSVTTDSGDAWDESLSESSDDESGVASTAESLIKASSAPKSKGPPPIAGAGSVPMRERRTGRTPLPRSHGIGSSLDIDGVNGHQSSAARHWIRTNSMMGLPSTPSLTPTTSPKGGRVPPATGLVSSSSSPRSIGSSARKEEWESDPMTARKKQTKHRLRPSKSFTNLIEMLKERDPEEHQEQLAKEEIARRKSSLSPMLTPTAGAATPVLASQILGVGLPKKTPRIGPRLNRASTTDALKSLPPKSPHLEQSESVTDEISPSAPSTDDDLESKDDTSVVSSLIKLGDHRMSLPPLSSDSPTPEPGSGSGRRVSDLADLAAAVDFKSVERKATAKAVERERKQKRRRKSNEFYAMLKADGSGGFDQLDLDESEAKRTAKKLAFDPSEHTAYYDPDNFTIVWSNGSRWMRKDFTPFVGRWRDPHAHVIQIDSDGKLTFVDAPEMGVYFAQISGFYKMIVTFQAFTYHAELTNTNTLSWDNGSVWKRVESEPVAVPADCLIM